MLMMLELKEYQRSILETPEANFYYLKNLLFE